MRPPFSTWLLRGVCNACWVGFGAASHGDNVGGMWLALALAFLMELACELAEDATR